jgi:hypothetical protein
LLKYGITIEGNSLKCWKGLGVLGVLEYNRFWFFLVLHLLRSLSCMIWFIVLSYTSSIHVFASAIDRSNCAAVKGHVKCKICLGLLKKRLHQFFTTMQRNHKLKERKSD